MRTLAVLVVCLSAIPARADIVQSVGTVGEVWANNGGVGQSFTVTAGELLVETVSFRWTPALNEFQDPTITARLRVGSGFGGAVLGTKTLPPIPDSTPNGAWIDFTFATPVALDWLQTYTLQFTKDSGFSGAYLRSTSNVYAGGVYYDANGVANANTDLAFRVINVVPEAAAWQFALVASAVVGLCWVRRTRVAASALPPN